ncbi:MAG TPA: hypothetical protein VIX15_05295 [Streptosporangiaceae bacterium]
MSVSGRQREAPAGRGAGLTGPATAAARRRRAERAVLAALAVAVLFFCYLRQSSSVPVSSDGSGNILQAWDMLHGNLLLRHWYSSDVSFYTTELPQYALIEALLAHWLGLGAWVVHVGAAMTYTLLVLLAALLAKGRAEGAAGLARALLAAGIMMAPQLSATSIVLLSPDHTGTAVPVLVAWLLIARGARGGRGDGQSPRDRGDPGGSSPRESPSPGESPSPRGYAVPAAVGVILAWTMVADSVVLITCIAPLVLVVVVRSFAALIRGDGGRAGRWYEPSLAGAALIAAGLGTLAPRVIKAVGGFHVWRIGTRSAPAGNWPHGAVVMAKGFLELFGANVFDAKPALALVFAVFHLAGVILVLWGLGLALRRLFRPDEFVVAVLAVAILINLGAYTISTHTHDLLGAREMVEVLPFGAALAGRMLGERTLAALRAAPMVLRPALAVVLAGYLGALGYGAAQTPAPPVNEPLVAWLTGHGFRDGLAGYWEANSTTVASGDRVLVSAVTRTDDGKLTPYQWETNEEDFDSSLHYANFLVAGGPAPLKEAKASAELTFGPPQRVYQFDGYIVMVWDTNLLDELVRFRIHP